MEISYNWYTDSIFFILKKKFSRIILTYIIIGIICLKNYPTFPYRSNIISFISQPLSAFAWLSSFEILTLNSHDTHTLSLFLYSLIICFQHARRSKKSRWSRKGIVLITFSVINKYFAIPIHDVCLCFTLFSFNILFLIIKQLLNLIFFLIYEHSFEFLMYK